MQAAKYGEKSLTNKSSIPLLFVVGNSRSGTTIMARVLGRSQSVHTFHELHFIEETWSPLEEEKLEDIPNKKAVEITAKLINTERDDYIGERNVEKYISEAEQYVAEMVSDSGLYSMQSIFKNFLLCEASLNDKMIPCEQTPRNIFFVKELLTIYPEAHIINMVRDPRAVLHSQKNRWKIRGQGARNIPIREVLRSWSNYHSIITSVFWNSSISAAEKNTSKRLTTIKYEDFVARPDVIIQEVCKNVCIPHDSNMLNIPRSEGGTSSFGQNTGDETNAGIKTGSVHRWKRAGGLSLAEIFLCQYITRRNMEKYGYDFMEVSIIRILFSVTIHLVSLPVKLGLAFILNMNRHKNIIETVKRRLG